MVNTELLFYDDHCAVCHGLVRFILARGEKKRERFRFIPVTALHAPLYRDAKDNQGRPLSGKSVVLIQNGVAYQKSEAIFRIAEVLGFPWNLAQIFRVIPFAFTDTLYDLFAKNRYKLFGRKDPNALCELPDPAVRRLFLRDLPHSKEKLVN